MKSYRMRSLNILLGSWLPNLLLIGLLVYGILHVMANPHNRFSWLFVIVPLTLLVSALHGLHQPTEIRISEDEVTFIAFGRMRTYKVADLQFVNVKRFAYVKQVLVSMGKTHVIGGRYWIDSRFDGYDEILAYFIELAQKVMSPIETAVSGREMKN